MCNSLRGVYLISLKRSCFSLLWILGSLCLSSAVYAGESANVIKNFAKALPALSLKDPLGKTYTTKTLVKKGLVLVVTAPILSNENDQKGWDEQLRRAKHGGAGRLVFLQDMTPSDFKDIAIDQMKKDYRPGVEPLLLLDHDGKVRISLGVGEKATVVLVYNSSNRLVYAETGPPSAGSAQKIWNSLK